MEMGQRRKGIILSYIAIMLQAIVSFFYVPILLNFMGQNEYGLYQLMGSLITYFSIMDFGLSSTVIKFYSQYDGKSDIRIKENILGMSRRIYYVLTLIMAAIGVIVYFNIDNIFSSSLSFYEIIESKKIFLLLLINIAVSLLTNIYTSIITANERFVFLKLLSITQIIIQPFVVIALLSASPRAFTLVIIQTAFNFMVGLTKLFYSKYILKVKITYHYLDKKLLKNMLSFSVSIFIVSIVDQIFWKGNQIILGIVSGTSIIAIYAIAAQIYMNYMPISTVIQGVFLPKISKLVSNKVSDIELSNYFIRIGRIQFILLACVLFGFIIYGKEFIYLWVGEKYLQAYLIALIILIPFTIDLIQNLGLTILQAKDLYSFRGKVYLITAIISIILSVFLSSRYGAIGAAAATGIAMLIGNGLAMNVFYYKVAGIDIPLFWKQIIKLLPSIIFTVLVSCAIKSIIPIKDFPSLILNGILYVCLYGFSIWVYGMNHYEKSLIVESINKLKKSI